ncbi:MAG: FAD-binding oxidoreductase [Bacteroidetes bacterium]|nr:FAD-binding oxidoreductase [Bacteroidota bacterium]
MTDLLIVGQGLAGSILALEAQKRGLSVLVADVFRQNSSSRVAGGLFNPITGRRFVKTWMADEIFPFAEQFYTGLEKETGLSFYHPSPIYRIFASEQQKMEFLNKIEEEDPAPFTPVPFAPGTLHPAVIHPHGGLVIPGGGWLNTDVFLDAVHQKLVSQGILHLTEFHPDQIEILPDGFQWKKQKARYLIMADGWYGPVSPWFNFLPFVPTKGEVLTISAPLLDLDEIISRSGFILPLKKGLFKVGATYSWDDLTFSPTPAGREELILKVKSMINVPFEIMAHDAGVRPTVRDRRPFIGWSPVNKSIGILNGFGTKGVSLIPWFVHHFLNHLQNGESLHPEANVTRFL